MARPPRRVAPSRARRRIARTRVTRAHHASRAHRLLFVFPADALSHPPFAPASITRPRQRVWSTHRRHIVDARRRAPPPPPMPQTPPPTTMPTTTTRAPAPVATPRARGPTRATPTTPTRGRGAGARAGSSRGVPRARARDDADADDGDDARALVSELRRGAGRGGDRVGRRGRRARDAATQAFLAAALGFAAMMPQITSEAPTPSPVVTGAKRTVVAGTVKSATSDVTRKEGAGDARFREDVRRFVGTTSL